MTDQKEQPNATNAVCDMRAHWPGVLGVPDYEPWLDGDPLQGGSRKLLSEDELREILSDDPGQQSPVARLVAAREGVLVAVANLVEWARSPLQPGDVLSVPPGSPMRGLLWRLCGAWQTYAALSGWGRPPQGGTHA